MAGAGGGEYISDLFYELVLSAVFPCRHKVALLGDGRHHHLLIDGSPGANQDKGASDIASISVTEVGGVPADREKAVKEPITISTS